MDGLSLFLGSSLTGQKHILLLENKVTFALEKSVF